MRIRQEIVQDAIVADPAIVPEPGKTPGVTEYAFSFAVAAVSSEPEICQLQQNRWQCLIPVYPRGYTTNLSVSDRIHGWHYARDKGGGNRGRGGK